MLKAWFLSVIVSLLLAGPAASQRPFLQDPALYTAAPRTARPASRVARQAPYKRLPGVAVFGWFPYWLPDSTYGRYNYSLLSHMAYYGYQATNQGVLLSPTGNPAGLVQAARKAKAGCKVLLSISYREPATGAGLFDTARSAQRQALTQAIMAQLGETKADGVNLDFSFTRRAAAPKRPSPAEAVRTQADLKKTLVALVQTREQIRADSIRLFNVAQQHDLAQFAQQPEAGGAAKPSGKPQTDAVPKSNKELDQKLAAQTTSLKKRAEAHQKKLALYHTKLAGFERSMAPPPAVLQDFLEDLVPVLRQKNPDYILTLTVPAVDSAAAYTRLADLAPLVQLFILKAYDYTATRPLVPGPVSPLRTQNTWGQSSIESSLRYYLRGGVQPTQLLVTFAQVGKVWADVPAQPQLQPQAGRKLPPSPFRYVANQVWQAWPVVSRLRDKASGSVYVQFGANPDSTVAGRPTTPQAAWVDDAESLAAKYRWVKEQGLGGIGLWAVGYEADSMMARPFIQAGLVAVSTAAPPPQNSPVATSNSLPGPLEKIHPPILNIVLFVVALLLGFALIGFGIGAALQMRYIAPFRTRLTRAGMLFGTGFLLFSIYLLLLFGPSISNILPWGFALLSLIVIFLIYSSLRPARVLP